MLFNFQLSETIISINSTNYKLVHSTEAVIEFLHTYLEFIDEFGF